MDAPKIGHYPGLNHGYTIERPGAGRRRDTPCMCELVEFTVHIPAYIRDQIVAESAKSNGTPDGTIAAHFRHFQTGQHTNHDPCTHIP